jgi:hypothetical protein
LNNLEINVYIILNISLDRILKLTGRSDLIRRDNHGANGAIRGKKEKYGKSIPAQKKKNQYQENLKNLLVPVSFLRDPTERGTSGRNYLRSETGTISRCGWFMGSGVCFMSEVGLF